MGRIVVGIDGSDESIRALEWAQGVAGSAHTVVAVHAWVYPIVGGDVGFGGGAGLAIPYDELEAGARELLDEAVARVDAGDVAREVELVSAGSPSGGLLKAAEGADLLVVGTRHHSTFDRLFLGSVAIQCAHHAPCPFVAVPVSAPPLDGEVAVAFDDSDHARAALAWAASVSAERGLPMRVVSVWERIGWNAGPHVADPRLTDDEQALAQLRAAVREVIGDAADAATFRPVHASSDVAEHLIEASDGASMLVMGSRGRGGFTGLLLGSVSQRCLESSPIPVAVLRD